MEKVSLYILIYPSTSFVSVYTSSWISILYELRDVPLRELPRKPWLFEAKNMGGLQAGSNWDDYSDAQWASGL